MPAGPRGLYALRFAARVKLRTRVRAYACAYAGARTRAKPCRSLNRPPLRTTMHKPRASSSSERVCMGRETERERERERERLPGRRWWETIISFFARYQSRNKFPCWRWLSQTPDNPEVGKAPIDPRASDVSSVDI